MNIYNKYQYEFESPEGLYAEIKMELRSYFESGAVDDTLFLAYTDTCLQKIGRSMLQTKYSIIELKNHKAILPEHIKYLNDVLYAGETSTIVSKPFLKHGHSEIKYFKDDELGENSDPICKKIIVYHDEFKQEQQTTFTYTRLVPVDVESRELCENPWYRNMTEFTAWYRTNGRILESNMRNGYILVSYKRRYVNDDGYLLIPAEQKFYDLLSNYIKYRLFEQLWHVVTDESSNQIQNKMLFYKQQYEESLIIARTEFNSKSYNEQLDSTRKRQNRFRRKYDIS